MDEMEKALIADGEKLRQLTDEDHGPWSAECCGQHRWGGAHCVSCPSMEMGQHIAWLRSYLSLMTADNWRDMKERCEYQIDMLSGTLTEIE